MSSAWLLPEHVADVLPSQARRVEELRRRFLDKARCYGFELVIPPLLEHLDSLLSGTGQALDLNTFKLVDQLSGRTLGVRADTTPQAARIDAHLLNRGGVTRLCYCGPVLHAQVDGLGSREPLQFGAEVFGHEGLEADLEVQELALDVLRAATVAEPVIDLADARLVRGLLAGLLVDAQHLQEVVQALSRKDSAAVADLSAGFPAEARDALQALMGLYGDVSVLERARQVLPNRSLIAESLADLRWLHGQLRKAYPDLKVGFDLSDMSGYAYYSGIRFAVFAAGCSDALARGGRYDEVGAVFGRRRPAVGFSLDVKAVATLVPPPPLAAAVRAPWSDDAQLRAAVRALRRSGETVLCSLPGHAHETQEFSFDRELVAIDNRWELRAL